MNRDHLLGWPPALLALDPEPRKSLRTPVRVRLSDASQREMRDIDKRETQALTAARAEQANPTVAPDPTPPGQLYVHKSDAARVSPMLYFKKTSADPGRPALVWGRHGVEAWQESIQWVNGELDTMFVPWTGPAPDAPPAEVAKPATYDVYAHKAIKRFVRYRAGATGKIDVWGVVKATEWALGQGALNSQLTDPTLNYYKVETLPIGVDPTPPN